MAEKWYAVRRQYRVEDAVYVKASSAFEARRKAEHGEYDDAAEPEVVSATRYGRTRRLSLDELPDENPRPRGVRIVSAPLNQRPA